MTLPFILGIIFGVLPVAAGVVFFVSMFVIDALRERISGMQPPSDRD